MKITIKVTVNFSKISYVLKDKKITLDKKSKNRKIMYYKWIKNKIIKLYLI